jgi:CspA family cold shock protein
MPDDINRVAEEPVHIGTVRFVSRDGDYGFISRDDRQPKVFVHISAVVAAGFNTLEKGQRWLFNIARTKDGRILACDLVAAF